MAWSQYQKNKKGILTGTVLFLVLNVVFFALVLFFAYQSTNGVDIKEKILAKQIASFINSAKPDTLMIFNIQEYLDSAQKKLSPEDILKIENGEVKIKLNEDSFVYSYFSDYQIGYKISGNFLEVSIS